MSDGKINYWMLIARDVKHLATLKQGDRSWWCVSKKYSQGDHAFIYQPRIGITCYIKLGIKATDRSFCEEHRLQTAHIEMLQIFDTALSIKLMRSNEMISKEAFLRRQFQGSAFQFASAEAAKEILRLAASADAN